MTAVPLSNHIDVRMATVGAFATPTWVDVTSDVLSVSWSRDKTGSGRGQLVLEDSDATYDPDKSGSSWGAKWHPVKIGMRGAVFPGSSGDYVSTPDSATLDNLEGASAEITCIVHFVDWNPPGSGAFIVGRWGNAGDRSWLLYWSSIDSVLKWYQSDDGTAQPFEAFDSYASYMADGVWLKIHAAPGLNGGSGWGVDWYTSTDGVSWTLRESDSSSNSATVAASSQVLAVGAQTGGGSPWTGRLGDVKVYEGTEDSGTLRAHFDPGRLAESDDTTFTASTGEVWTFNGNSTPRPFLFWGFIKPPWRRVQTSPNTAQLQLEIVDAAAILQSYEIDLGDAASPRAAELSADRIQWVLGQVATDAGLGGWPTSWGNVADSAASVFVAAGSGTTNAWSHLQGCARAEGPHCAVIVNRSGQVELFGRHSLSNTFGASVSAGQVVTDSPSTGELAAFHQGWEMRTARALSFASVSTQSGYETTDGSAASSDVPEVFSAPGLILRDDNDADGLAAHLLQARSGWDPFSGRVSVELAAEVPSDQDNAGNIDVLSQVWTQLTPVNTGAEQTHGHAVVALAHTVDVGGSWVMTLELEPQNWHTAGVTATQLFVLGTSSWGGSEVFGF